MTINSVSGRISSFVYNFESRMAQAIYSNTFTEKQNYKNPLHPFHESCSAVQRKSQQLVQNCLFKRIKGNRLVNFTRNTHGGQNKTIGLYRFYVVQSKLIDSPSCRVKRFRGIKYPSAEEKNECSYSVFIY